MPPTTRRRWSKRTLVLVVVGLVAATVVLSVGLVGFARSIGFVTRIGIASEVLKDADESINVARVGDAPVTPSIAASGDAERAERSMPPTTPSRPAAGKAAEPVAAPAGGAGQAVSSGGAQAGGSGPAGGSTSSGGQAGASGQAGRGGEPPQVASNLALVAATTAQVCGRNTCNVGQVCCNFSCGICAAPGATCDQSPCSGGPRAPTAVRCGSGQCNDGQVCCNPSCGICAAPGETCSTQTCP